MVEQLILPPPTEPMAVARELLAEFQLDELLTLRSWRGSWTRWATTHWQEVEPAAVRSAVDHKLENALYIAGNPPKMKPWAPTRPKVANVLDAIAAISHLRETTNPPTWMEKMIPAATVVSCANGLLDITSRQLIDHSPAFFNVVAVPFPFDPTAQE